MTSTARIVEAARTCRTLGDLHAALPELSRQEATKAIAQLLADGTITLTLPRKENDR